MADSLNNLASLLSDRGNYKDAEALYRESLEIRRRVLGEKHPVVGASRSNLAVLLFRNL